MAGDNSASILREDFAAAQARIAELEAEIARLREGQRWPIDFQLPVPEANGEKPAQKDLRQETRVVEQIYDAIIATDLEGKITHWNQGAQRIYGYDAREALGLHIESLFFEEDRPSIPSRLIGPLRKQEQLELELRTRRRSDEQCYVRLCLSLLRDEADAPNGILAVAIDISAQKEAEQALRESEERFRLASQAMEGLVYDWFPKTGRVQRLGSLNKILGVTADEAEPTESWWQERVHPEDLEASSANVILRLSKDEKNYATEFRIRHADGHWVHVAERGFIIRDENGAPIRVVGSSYDISDRKRAEAKIRQHAKQLTRANEDLLHFAYAASHDLQAPLRTVMSFAQLLALKYKAKLDAQGGEFIRWIVDASARMDTMLRDLLQFAKVAGGEAELSSEISLDDALATALESLRSGIEETGAVVTSAPLPAVAGDAGQFAQLFENLIGNSLKYRRADAIPRIHISAERNEGDWVVSVQDNGIGFNPEYAEQIFGVFKRLHTDEFSGTGIGLSICKRIVERRGGRIWAMAQPEQGATFSFSIPLEISAAGGTAEPMPAQTGSLTALEILDQPIPSRHFDELFHTLALAQAVVRELDGTISIWTQGSQKLFGWTEAEAVGKRIQELLRTELPQSETEIEADLLRNGEWRGELKAHKRDGSVVWVVSHKILYRDGSGRPQSVIEVHDDITALKETEAALLRSSEQRDLALRAGQMGVWSWDSRTGAVVWSHTLESFLGMTPGSFEGTFEAFQDRMHPDDRQPLQNRISEAFQHGPDYFVENRLRRNDGSYCWVRGRGKVTFDERNQPVGLIGLVWDISEHKQKEADRQFLLDLGAKLSRSSDTAELLDIVLADLSNFMGVTRGSYFEDERARQLLDPSGSLLEGLRTTGWVAVADTQTDPLTASIYATNHMPQENRSFLAVAVYAEGERHGQLVLSEPRPRIWKEREIDLLRGVTERLGPALENAHLLQETRERQQQFESTFEQAAVGLAHVSLDGRFLRINERFCQISGYTKDELLTLRFQDITHPDDLAEDLQQYDALQRGEMQSYSIEKRYLQKSGSTVWVNLTVSLVRQTAGTPRYAISVIEDITARKHTEQALQTAQRLAAQRTSEIEALYSQAPVGLFLLDKDLRYVRVNDYLAKIDGITIAGHLGHTMSELFPQLGSELEATLREVMDSRRPVVDMEVRVPTQIRTQLEGTWLVSYFPLEGPDGSLLGLHGVIQDITQRKEQENARLDVAERLRIATSAAALGVFLWNADEDRVLWENGRMYEITGRKVADGPINNAEFVRNVVHPEDASLLQQALMDAAHPGGLFHHACRFRRGDGELRWAEFSGQFDLAPNGTELRLTGVMADITQQMETERALRDQKQFLRSVLESLYIFVGVLSLDGILIEVNQAPLAAADIQAGDVIGKLFDDTHWWSYSTEAQSRIRDSIDLAQAGKPSRFDIQARMKDGHLMTIDYMISPLREEGEIRYFIASAVPIEERKQMEEALRQSEERYRLAEWATNDGLWDWNPGTDYCYFSPQFKSLLGFADHEMENTGAAVFSKLHPESNPRLFEAVRLNFEERKAYDIEIQLQLKDGNYRWFRTRGDAVRDEAGGAVRMVGSMSDIHDRKEAEALKREHDEQLRRMIDSIEQLAWMADADGYIFWYNRRWYEYTGKTVEQMQGWGWQSVHDPERLPEVMERWQQSLRTGEPLRMEFPLLGFDGVYRPFLTRVLPVHDSQGRVVRWFGTNTNIEALRREQDLLKESERKFRELAETLPDLLWASDAEGQITYWNPQLYAYTGCSQGGGLANKWISIVHPDEAERLSQLWQESVALGRHHEHEARLRRHDGVYRWFLHRAQPIRDEQGNISKWLGTSTDIHEQKLTEQALRRSNEDLEQFAYAASHDLQEPLRTVSIYSQLLARRYGGEGKEAERFATYIVNGTARMDSLLKGVLAYSRVGEAIEDRTTCDSESVLVTALHNLESAIAEGDAQITHDVLPAVACPETHLLQLFQNLIGNAIRYRAADRSPRIHLSAVREGNWYKFSVSDNGIGIKAEYTAQIFGMFKRLHRDEYPGIGVGLAICKRIVERHGGWIWVESEVGVGTTFYFTLPASQNQNSG